MLVCKSLAKAESKPGKNDDDDDDDDNNNNNNNNNNNIGRNCVLKPKAW